LTSPLFPYTTLFRSRYTLGKGHMLFFYTRLGYLVRRHQDLVTEMKRRGYKPSFDGVRREQFPDIPDKFWNDWRPDEEALRLNRQDRKSTRLNSSHVK